MILYHQVVCTETALFALLNMNYSKFKYFDIGFSDSNCVLYKRSTLQQNVPINEMHKQRIKTGKRELYIFAVIVMCVCFKKKSLFCEMTTNSIEITVYS